MKTWRWQVQVSGDLTDLLFLERQFSASPVRVVGTDGQGGFLIESEAEFADLVESCAVKARADELAQFLAGFLQIERGTAGHLRTGGVYKKHDDGRQDAIVFPGGVQARAEVGVVNAHGGDDSGGLVKAQPQRSPALRAVEIALSDRFMAKVLRLLGQGALSWVELYRICEVMEDDLNGHHKTIALSWIDEDDYRLFKRSACSDKAAGDAARHGGEDNTPPFDPMTLGEARSFLNQMVVDWIKRKLQAVPVGVTMPEREVSDRLGRLPK